jgi:hypothetical protein
MKPAVIETIARRLKVSNPALAEQGYQDLLRATERKPYPSVDGLIETRINNGYPFNNPLC